MENFHAAFLERAKDVEVLAQNDRRRAAMHFGGVTVECLLKAVLCASLPSKQDGTKEWYNDSNSPGHKVYNPGHNYQKTINEAQRYNRRLKARLQQVPQVLQWLEDIERPDMSFIDMRYSEQEPDEQTYQQWKQSYKRLLGWLQRSVKYTVKDEG